MSRQDATEPDNEEDVGPAESAHDVGTLQRSSIARTGFDDTVISLYGKGLTTGEIPSHLAEIYDTAVSAELVSEITDRVLTDFQVWQNRPLDEIWPVVVIDAIRIRTLPDKVRKTPVYVATGISLQGQRETLGLWYANDLMAGESSSWWWANVLIEQQNRGIQDILYLCGDGLSGLPDAVKAVFCTVA